MLRLAAAYLSDLVFCSVKVSRYNRLNVSGFTNYVGVGGSFEMPNV